MASRRQGNHNPRIKALPEGNQIDKSNGVYYHASFYDLHAANHITMLPNSIEFVEKELNHAYEVGIKDFWIINSSNIKPHVYFLNYISKLWKEEVNKQDMCLEYIKDYYSENTELISRIYQCFEDYANATIMFGNLEDEHSGEQFYNYSIRIFLNYWKMNSSKYCAKELIWATGEVSVEEQIKWYEEKCKEGIKGFEQLYQQCLELAKELGQENQHAKQLFEDSILLQVNLHYACIKGSLEYCTGYYKFIENDLIKSFYYVGRAAQEFDYAVQAMNMANHDKWKGFYDNDCLSDVKQTVYLLKQMMGHIRNIGDGPHFYQWQREFLYKEEDKRVVLITNMEILFLERWLYHIFIFNHSGYQL